MSLPPVGRDVYWKEYRISTPSFEITPVEKPDMSPFLFHMTGKEAIESILQGKGKAGFGFLRASVPEYEGEEAVFDAEVVCLTESPTFALDFFRYRSFKRWKADQRFGVGFRKAALVRRGVRPAVYLDEPAVKSLIHLKKEYVDAGKVLSEDKELNERLKRLVGSLYPISVPLYESKPQQGFIWEREWRYPAPEGLEFEHSEICLICCPEEEEAGIRTRLGPVSESIQFIRAWREYNEVTEYLRSRSRATPLGEPAKAESLKDVEAALEVFNARLREYSALMHSVENFSGVLASLTDAAGAAEPQLKELRKTMEELKATIDRLEEKRDSLTRKA